jgi:hypothetical protein
VPPISVNRNVISAPGTVYMHFEEEIKGHETGDKHTMCQNIIETE